MQSWPNAGQNGATDEHNSWQSGFGFSGQNGQYDPSQPWAQPGTDQAASYSHLGAQDASSSNFFESSHQGGSFLSSSLHDNSSNQPAFHGGHGTMPLNQQYSQAGQDVIDPAFNNIHPELYGHQGKVGLTDELGHMAQVQGLPHAHSQPFSQHDFSFAQQNDQTYDSPAPAYTQPQLLAQSTRQGSHTPVQHFDNLHAGYPQGHRFARPPQQPPVQQQPQQQQQQQQPYNQNQQFTQPINGQTNQYQANNNLSYQQTGQAFTTQPGYAPPKSAYSQRPQSTTVQHRQPSPQSLPRISSIPATQPVSNSGANTIPVQSDLQYGSSQRPLEIDNDVSLPATPEPATKRRKQITKSNLDAIIPEPSPQLVESSIDGFGKKVVEDVDSLPTPLPSAEEVTIITQFGKRNKAAQAKYPSIKGLSHLVYEGSIKLPAPKSYDKLSPLVALPARSGRRMVPELGYELPCELQGKFTSKYRPSYDKAGLDERRDEAKTLLDDYDRSMKSLGKRRPKYTEYPHAFKEQLKSDEASKNKAEKKAKKELEDERTKPIRPINRPLDLVEGAAWDAIGIVHLESSIARTNALIAGRVQQAGDFFIKLRGEMNRAKAELDQATKDKEPESELAKLKFDAEQKKEALYRALDVTIEHADDSVLDNLGGHQKMILSLVNVLIASIKAGDFSGKLPKAVLELFTHFRMTRKIAETTNFETVRKRFEDKGDDETKDFARQLSLMIKKVNKASDSDTTTGYTGTSAASRAKTSVKPSNEPSSTKRARDDDLDTRTVKKIAVESGGGSLSKKLAQPKILPQSTTKIVAPKAPVSSLLPGKSRPIPKPIPKPDITSVDNSIASIDERGRLDSRKANTKLDAVKPAISKIEAKPVAPKVASSSSSSALSGIASLLDSINAPKAEAPVANVKEGKGSETPEDPEQKAKRLRKEARRKLRVTWKPEAELVQVKIFHKDDDEDTGRANNMIRDAADDRSEGMVLKQRADAQDDEEDDDVPYQPWLGPVATDFSGLSEDVRSKSYITRGGNLRFSTSEQQVIAEREQKELMALYTDPDDIPATPKSPPLEPTATLTDSKIGQLPQNDPKFEEIQIRWRDEQHMGLEEAAHAAVRRLDAKHGPTHKLDSILGRLQGSATPSTSAYQKPSSAVQSQPTANYTNLPLLLGPASEEQLLHWVQLDKTKSWKDPNPAFHGDVVRAYQYTDPEVQLVAIAVENVVTSLAGKSYPANSPPEWMLSDEERVREWWLGFNKELAARQKKEDEERAKSEAEANAVQAATAAAAAAASTAGSQGQAGTQDWGAYYNQQQYAPYMALLQQMTGGQHQPAQQQQQQQPSQQSQIPDLQLHSILAAINQPSQQPPQTQAPNPVSYLNPNDPSYQQYLMLTQMAQGQAGQASQPPQNHGSERDWERDRSDSQGGRGDQYKDGKDPRKKKGGPLPPHKPANKALIGTKPCTFWQQGKCARGDKCTFRHD